MQRPRAALSFQRGGFQWFSIAKRRAWLSPGQGGWLRRWRQLCERSFIATQRHRRDSRQARRVPGLHMLPTGTAVQPKQTEYIELRCFPWLLCAFSEPPLVAGAPGSAGSVLTIRLLANS